MSAAMVARSTLRRACLLAALLPLGDALAADECSHSIFDITASVEFIKPADSRVTVRHDGAPPRSVGAGGCLVAGDVVIVPQAVEEVRLFANDEFTTLRPTSPPFEVRGGLAQVAGRVTQYLGDLKEALREEPTRALPRTSAVRGGDSLAPPPQPVHGLDVPGVVQRVCPRCSPGILIVAWNEGGHHADCVLTDGAGTAISHSNADYVSWCAVQLPERSMPSDAVLQVVVNGREAAALRWPLAEVDGVQVPRPPWLGAAAPIDKLTPEWPAWGIWLYCEQGPEWRLMGLAMLYSARASSWLSARAYRLALTGEDGFCPASAGR